ncbi:hypothetical protein PAXRUDRAFT_797258 [Paxillus rubicundulus Ve08.2h10]|uniref:Uncharacterized protein n=1 Tax=Paxillus rubicundulus Ve08.2h10 TaxID=930991 RepID=A0A0D0D7A8_9AGAM|nr:hypothetical protein PAXRUDRAFT_797258 [Paxillus rubicundulus Ve08.2h10]
MSDLSPSNLTTTEQDAVTSPLAPSHGHHETKISVQPHGIAETSSPPSLHRECMHKGTAHVIIKSLMPESINENSTKSREAKHPSKHPVSSHELNRLTQRRGVSDLEIATHTDYVDIFLALDRIASHWNILAALLHGFCLPVWGASSLGTLERVAGYVQQIPLWVYYRLDYALASMGQVLVCCLWWRWHKNYICISRMLFRNDIYRPGLLNPLAGTHLTLANVYGAQQGTFCELSKSTQYCRVAFVCALLIIVYHLILLGGLKKNHDKQVVEQLMEEMSVKMGMFRQGSESTDSVV